MKAIILAGGSGERFWPLSNSKTPKQFLKIFSNKSLLRETFERLNHKLSKDDIFVVTSEKHFINTKNDIPELSENNIILEPIARNTAPACMLATLCAKNDDIVLILPADHYIPDWINFWKTVDLAIKAAENDSLITFGISPNRPETGYGYIEKSEEISKDIFNVKSFREKPNLDTAIDFLKSNNFLWNSGMFVWKKSVFMNEMKLYNRDMYDKMNELNPKNIEKLRKIMPEVERISIDYALMEKSKNVKCIQSNFTWSDVGNWVSVRELEGYSDKKENIYLFNSKNVFIHSNKKVGIVGLENIVLIETDDGILISKEDSVQNVRNIVEQLKKEDEF
ncbi:MAG: mannose-phosphate guanylyltransferase [Oceanotoga sp.]|uniref:mannose-1-phosphate guanylyltransferase n=1 Tax=Oceanotoga sp. TaxID=2108366 RepID=UPI00264C1BFD|nr:mannose-1-phosphate guanylyltransferase [Oceanotoga sp.]MDN5341136.1 mannose-phosphate guanylyltransferase [Oceanotoga sp.]